MPDEKAAPQVHEPDLDQEPFKFSWDSIADSFALSLVNKTFDSYEAFRTRNHDRRFSTADYLYFGWVPPKVWEGTSIPRSCLGVPIVFDQVEAALPVISASVFGGGDDWFSVAAEPGASQQEARGLRDYLDYVLEHPNEKYGSSCQNEFEAVFKDILLYGNGGIHYYWDQVKGIPQMRAVDIRDFYIDPGATSPSVSDCRSVIWRKLMTPEDLMLLKDQPGMRIPAEEILNWMAKNTPIPSADSIKRQQEAYRGVSYTPGASDYIPNPAERRIEVLVYYSKDRIIWVLNRVWTAFNQPNPYGCIPFDFAPCYTVPGRWYAQSFADVQEGNQRYMEALLNARLDEVNLALHPPRIQKRSASNLTPSQQRWRPGAVFTAEEARDMALLQPRTAIENVYSEIQFIQLLAEKRTGINAMGQGIPRPGNANRTATGIQAQMQGSASRLTYIVKNIENYLIVPMLYKLQKIAQVHSQDFEWLPAKNADREQTYVPVKMLYKKYQFRMFASSKMMTREKLSQIFPFLMQYLLSGPFMGQLSKSGQTIDFGELLRMLQDATGASRYYQLVRPMTPEEQQAAQQPPPEVMMQQQMMQMKTQAELQKEMLKKQPSPEESQREQAKLQMEMERDRARIFSEQMLARIKQQAAEESARIKRETEALKLELMREKARINTQSRMEDAGIKRASLEAEAQMKMAERMSEMAETVSGNVQDRIQASREEKESEEPRYPGAGEPRKKAEVRKKSPRN